MISLLCQLAAISKQLKFTLLSMDDGQFMVIIQPSAELAKDYPALSAPLQIVESADKLEAEVKRALLEYVPALADATSNVKAVLAAMKKEGADRAAASQKKADDAAAKKNKPNTANTAVKPGVTANAPPPPGLLDLFAPSSDKTLVPTDQLETAGGFDDGEDGMDGQ